MSCKRCGTFEDIDCFPLEFHDIYFHLIDLCAPCRDEWSRFIGELKVAWAYLGVSVELEAGSMATPGKTYKWFLKRVTDKVRLKIATCKAVRDWLKGTSTEDKVGERVQD